MKCPNCGEDDNEVNQTHSQHNFMMKANLRTRYCHGCGYLFDTEEKPNGEVYKKKQGKKRPKIDENQPNFFGG